MVDPNLQRPAFEKALINLDPSQLPESFWQNFPAIPERMNSYYVMILANTLQASWLEDWENKHPQETSQIDRYFSMYDNLARNCLNHSDASAITENLIDMEEPDLFPNVLKALKNGQLYEVEQMARFLVEKNIKVPDPIKEFIVERGGDFPTISGERES